MKQREREIRTRGVGYEVMGERGRELDNEIKREMELGR